MVRIVAVVGAVILTTAYFCIAGNDAPPQSAPGSLPDYSERAGTSPAIHPTAPTTFAPTGPNSYSSGGDSYSAPSTAIPANPPATTGSAPATPHPAPPLHSGPGNSSYVPGATGYTPGAASSTATGTSSIVLSGKKKWEAVLSRPANLNFTGRESVTVKEILDGLRAEHQLSIRFDIPTLSALFGEEGEFLQNPKPDQKVTASASDTSVATGAVPDASAAPAMAPSKRISLHSMLLTVEVRVQHVDTSHVSTATLLRHAFDAVPIMSVVDAGVAGLPIRPTNAAIIDYLVEEDGLLLTTRLNALTVKETRVYPVDQLNNVQPAELAKVIRHSIRPWSWRSQINDLGEQLMAGLPADFAQDMTSKFALGLQMATTTPIFAVQPPTCPDGSCPPPSYPQNTVPASPYPAPSPTASASPGLGVPAKAVVNGLVTTAHATLSAMEMLHFSDPPTGTIETLPGKIVVTQSQAAHREIEELLKQLMP